MACLLIALNQKNEVKRYIVNERFQNALEIGIN